MGSETGRSTDTPGGTGVETGETGQIEAAGALGDPVRRRLYERIGSFPAGATRQELADSAGIKPSLAAYHLDRLAGAGLIEVGRERRTGRTGPGAGRPANVYRRSAGELNVSIPPRDYPLLAGLLAEAVSGDADGTTGATLRKAARRVGRAAAAESGQASGTPVERLVALLAARGYEPQVRADGTIRLANCPFHLAARQRPEVVCGLNEALLGGMVEAFAEAGMTAELAPAEGCCCVVIRPAGVA